MLMNVVCDLSYLLFYCNTIIYVKMSTDDEINSPRLCSAVFPAKMSTNKKIQSVSLNCEVCNALYEKISTNEEIQSPCLSCEDCECIALLTKKSAYEDIQSQNASTEVCNALLAKASTNERNQPSGLSCEDCECIALPTKKSAYEDIQSQNASAEVCNELLAKASTNERNQPSGLSCEDCECEEVSTKMSTHQKTQSQCSSSEALPSKGSTDEEIQLASVTFNNEALPKKLLFNESESLSDETYIAGEVLCTKMSIDQEIQPRSWTCETLPKKLLSNESESLSDETYIVGEDLCTKMSIDQEIQPRSWTCEALPKKMSNESRSESGETCIGCEELFTKMSNDEEIHSRSMSCEAIPKKMSTADSISSCCDAETESGTDIPTSQIRAMGPLSPLDPSSYARPELAIIKHISLSLNVDFETHVLSGQAMIDFDVLQDINDLVLDASELTIESIELKDGTQLQYKMGDHLANMGSKLTILLPKPLTADEKISVKIKYTTSPQASALQWLDPEQTSGKKHPYLFSQCQPIHARSILPCQDTPAVKFTYDAEVTAPEEFTVLMSALRGEVKNNKTTFRQPMPLPSYLVALAVGVLESRTLGPRSKVWSEKEEIERSAWEFAETEKYLQAAEKMCGKYEWTQYDLLVLPPSFPYGGMENPCLTFVTPTLLAGDRSQADVIVHEIMHSWTGNLVTNRNFEHFWLNEGFTVFLERKVGASLINDSVEAKKSRDFQSLLGLQELNEAIEVFGSTSPLTNLVVDLNGIHPDDAFSRVPYEKGSLFLRYLEDQVGGPEVFDDFLRAYLTKFRKKSLDTEEFKSFLLDYFKDNAALKEVDWDTWLYKSGMPPIIPDYDTSMTKAISGLIVKIDDPNATVSHDDVKTFCPHQMIHLLQRLIDRPALSLERLTTLGTEYKINGNKNSEILYRWLRLCIRSRDETKLSEVFNFVNSQGRMKYVRPLYRDLYAWEDVREQAIDNFLKNEKYMMHVSAYTLRKDLHLDESTKE